MGRRILDGGFLLNSFLPLENQLRLLKGAPIAGYLLEAYSGEEGGFQAYRPAMFYAGSMALGSAGLVLLVRLRSSTKVLVKM